MDRLDLSDQPSSYAAFREPPPRKRNTLRAALIIVSSCLLSNLILVGCFLAYRHTVSSPPPQQSITKQEMEIPYPPTRRAVARQFGGRPSSWHRLGSYGWNYDGLEPIELTIGGNVEMWTFQAGLHWPVSDAQKKG